MICDRCGLGKAQASSESESVCCDHCVTGPGNVYRLVRSDRRHCFWRPAILRKDHALSAERDQKCIQMEHGATHFAIRSVEVLSDYSLSLFLVRCGGGFTGKLLKTKSGIDNQRY